MRDFLHVSRFEAENRRFPASFSYRAILTELKKYDFCDASATFQATHKILSLPPCHVCAALTLRFIKTATAPRHKLLRLPQNCKTHKHKVLHLPREHNRVALTRFQSIAPATQHANAIQKVCRKTPQNHAICEEIQLQQNGREITQYYGRRRTAANGGGRQRPQEPRSANTVQPPDPHL